jgi:hypothetical protein
LSKELLVYGKKTFKITVPDDATITFGPFSPPTRGERGGGFGGPERAVGTLRIYHPTKANILACFADVSGFRDLSLGYQEQVAVEEGATIWKSDQDGYTRESKVTQRDDWIEGDVPAITNGGKKAKK